MCIREVAKSPRRHLIGHAGIKAPAGVSFKLPPKNLQFEQYDDITPTKHVEAAQLTHLLRESDDALIAVLHIVKTKMLASKRASQVIRNLCSTCQPSTLPSTASRLFSSSSGLQAKKIKATLIPSDLIPSYPYGEAQTYHQSNRGLYGGLRKQYGHNVSEHKNKTRRTWKPNVHRKIYRSAALGARIKVRLTTRVIRTIKKEGGLDAYLLGTKPARIKELGPGGWKLRWLVMQSQAVRDRYKAERERLGVGEEFVEGVSDAEAADMVRIALDKASPGGLSRPTRDAILRRKEEFELKEAFILGSKVEELQGLTREESEEWEEVPEPEFVALEEAAEEFQELQKEDMARRMGWKPSEKDSKGS